jgi:hypothetical protein
MLVVATCTSAKQPKTDPNNKTQQASHLKVIVVHNNFSTTTNNTQPNHRIMTEKTNPKTFTKPPKTL